jgi:N-acetylmuramoyl-L-alanine amidase-like protein/putative peptidoglycan binding protein
MSFSLIWMPFALRKAGLKVAPVNGWESRGRGDVGETLGVLCHHTAGPKNGNMPSLGLLIAGRPELPGPLAQLGLGRDGTYYVVAAGRCNHAGVGDWNGVTSGNTHFIGIEAENTGRPDDPWPAVQVDAYQRGVAALLKHAGLSAESCAGHKEYALPAGRKPDPTFDMKAFRASVAAFIAGTAPAPVLIPADEPSPPPGTATRRPTLRRGAKGDFVKQVQKALGLGLDVDGDFGGKTEAAVRAFQRQHLLVPDGIVGPKTWAQLDKQRA